MNQFIACPNVVLFADRIFIAYKVLVKKKGMYGICLAVQNCVKNCVKIFTCRELIFYFNIKMLT